MNKMDEATLQTRFNLWAKYYWTTTAKFELKITKGKSFPYRELVEHQRDNLKSKKVVYKIPDSAAGGQKPFDSFVMVDVPGYVVIQFYTKGEKQFYIIEINKFEEYEKSTTRKSLTEPEALSICDHVAKLA